MYVSEAELERLLVRFSGKKVDSKSVSSFKFFALEFFTKNTIPTFRADVPLDATIIQAHYNVYYQRNHSSFNAFIYYQLIQTMQNTDFSFLRYRYLNEEWYEFDNLPFFISVKASNPAAQQVGFFIENVGRMTWREFVRAYAAGIAEHRASNTDSIPDDRGWYAIAHLLTNMPFNFTGYTPSQKHDNFYAHAPWFVVGQRHQENEALHLTLSCTVSHACGLPSELDAFLKALKSNLLAIPEKQKIISYFAKAPSAITTVGAISELNNINDKSSDSSLRA